MKIISIILLSTMMTACAGVSEEIKPVNNFELDKYMGTWYEIARLDHSFERGLEQVSATYTENADGTVRVLNKGYLPGKDKWKDAIGKAKFAEAPDKGHLKVSFFGPFYGSYIIFEMDQEDYQYAFITGSKNTLWLLSRTPTVNDELKDRFIKTVRDLGYASEELIFVNQK